MTGVDAAKQCRDSSGGKTHKPNAWSELTSAFVVKCHGGAGRPHLDLYWV